MQSLTPNKIKPSGFHIEPTNICTLKCPGCERTRFIEQWGKHWKNYSVDIDALMQFIDCDLDGTRIHLCGNTGDPIYHPDLHELIRRFKNRGACIKIVTNGSYNTAAWWQDLCALLDKNDIVCFSIDGLPSNFTQYRINADWNSIKTGIDTTVAAECKTIWKYIPFKFNQTDVDEARQLSIQMGVDQFEIRYSDRFDNVTQQYIPMSNLLGSRYQAQIEWKQNKSVTVDPECKDNTMHYISAAGYYMPCCYIGDYRFYYKNEFGKHREKYNIANTTFSKLMQQQEIDVFNRALDQHPVCQYNCPQKTFDA